MAARASAATSRAELFDFVAATSAARLAEANQRPGRFLVWWPCVDFNHGEKQGMGNQLYQLGHAALLAAATRRTLLIDVHEDEYHIEWLWRDYYELPMWEWRTALQRLPALQSLCAREPRSCGFNRTTWVKRQRFEARRHGVDALEQLLKDGDGSRDGSARAAAAAADGSGALTPFSAPWDYLPSKLCASGGKLLGHVLRLLGRDSRTFATDRLLACTLGDEAALRSDTEHHENVAQPHTRVHQQPRHPSHHPSHQPLRPQPHQQPPGPAWWYTADTMSPVLVAPLRALGWVARPRFEAAVARARAALSSRAPADGPPTPRRAAAAAAGMGITDGRGGTTTGVTVSTPLVTVQLRTCSDCAGGTLSPASLTHAVACDLSFVLLHHRQSRAHAHGRFAKPSSAGADGLQMIVAIDNPTAANRNAVRLGTDTTATEPDAETADAARTTRQSQRRSEVKVIFTAGVAADAAEAGASAADAAEVRALVQRHSAAQHSDAQARQAVHHGGDRDAAAAGLAPTAGSVAASGPPSSRPGASSSSSSPSTSSSSSSSSSRFVEMVDLGKELRRAGASRHAAFAARLPVMLDWQLFGEGSHLFASHSTFGFSALARRSAPPRLLAIHAPEEHGCDNTTLPILAWP